MRALRYRRDEHAYQLTAVDVDPPQPGPGQVRVRVAFCGVCGSDRARDRAFRSPDASMTAAHGPASATIGHEISGVVDSLGPDTGPTWSDGAVVAGSRVAVNPLLGCGACQACQHGRWNRCGQPSERRVIGYQVDGGMAEYVCVPVDHVVRVPDGVPGLDLGALAEPLAVARHAVDVAAAQGTGNAAETGPALVVGDGPIAALIAHTLRSRGQVSVAMLGRHPRRLAMARGLGVTTAAVHPDELDGPYPRAFLAAGTPDALRTAMDLLSVDGVLTCVGYLDAADPGHAAGLAPAAFNELIRRHQTVRGAFGYDRTGFAAAVADLASSHTRLRPLVTDIVDLLPGAAEALTALMDSPDRAGKVLLRVSPPPGQDL